VYNFCNPVICANWVGIVPDRELKLRSLQNNILKFKIKIFRIEGMKNKTYK